MSMVNSKPHGRFASADFSDKFMKCNFLNISYSRYLHNNQLESSFKFSFTESCSEAGCCMDMRDV